MEVIDNAVSDSVEAPAKTKLGRILDNTEKVMLVVIGVGLLFRIFSLPFAGMMLFLGGLILSSMYFLLLPVYVFTDKQYNGAYSKVILCLAAITLSSGVFGVINRILFYPISGILI